MLRIVIFLFPFFLFATPNFELLQGSKATRWKKLKEEDFEDLRFYKNLFQKNYQDVAQEEKHIPNVAHFIWLGPKPYPEESTKNILSWKELHPDWVFKFWTEDPNRECPVSGMEKHLISELDFCYIGPFLERTKNWAEKSDMLRYEILFKEGGVYVDHDVACYRSFFALNAAYDFYAGLEAPHIAEGQRSQIFPCNCIIGAIAGHPLLDLMLKKLTSRWEEVEKKYNTVISRVMHRTFLSFTEAVREQADDPSYKNILFPAFYFFPSQVYSSKLQKRLSLEGTAYASHAFAGLWTDGPASDIQRLEKKQHEQLKKIHKRINRLYYLCGAALGLVMLLLVLQWKNRKNIY